ncbi:hypothetical protein PINS_up006469 [Pythium insidiosum]|nr:hypothetical protein PINS_up006469 [Pythium insidiosum]
MATHTTAIDAFSNVKSNVFKDPLNVHDNKLFMSPGDNATLLSLAVEHATTIDIDWRSTSTGSKERKRISPRSGFVATVALPLQMSAVSRATSSTSNERHLREKRDREMPPHAIMR